MIEAMSQTVADVIGRIVIISIWKTHPRRSPINEKSPILTILTTSENQAYIPFFSIYNLLDINVGLVLDKKQCTGDILSSDCFKQEGTTFGIFKINVRSSL